MNEILNFIGGRWVPALSGETMAVCNPATGEPLARAAVSSGADVDAAVRAARRAFDEEGTWRRMPAPERSARLLAVADAMERRGGELAMLECLNTGKPLREAESDVNDAAACFRFMACAIRSPNGFTTEVSGGFGPMHAFALREPLGVCALIVPWNYPLLMAAWKLAPALAAGNAVVCKPSSLTPLSAQLLFTLLAEAGIPDGTANLVLGEGERTGGALAAHPGIDLVAFTGSTEAGRSVALAAAANLKRTVLELGGKSPHLIFADADLDSAVEWAMLGTFYNQGEVCSACARIYVERPVYQEFLRRLAGRVGRMTIGPGTENPDMGALISRLQLEKVLRFVAGARQEGARLVCGGSRYTEGHCAKGWFMAPTILAECTHAMRIVREETFGPVACVMPFDTEAEAVRLANDTVYGLASAVQTADGARALRVTRELRCGIAWVNCCQTGFCELPWGGRGQSGYGRDLSLLGLEEYQSAKSVSFALQPGAPGWYEN